MNYQEFINNKMHLSGSFGFDTIWTPDYLFDFQKYIVDHAIKKGRCAVFADTGLGKTAMQLTIAENIVRKTNKSVLILTPLAVAFQFILESEKVGTSKVEYSKDGKYSSKIVVTNYERLHYFDSKNFECVILDESSILKNFDGRIKAEVTQFIKNVKYRFLFTATPSPNDFIELGTSSEALGYMGYMDMLGKFFSNNERNIKSQNIGAKFYLKPHAKQNFFRWVSSWSISIRKPSDLGFSDDNYNLPDLIVNKHLVKNTRNWIVNGQVLLYPKQAQSLSEVQQEKKMTIVERCEKAVELAEGKTSVYWCGLNDEGDRLNEMDKEAIQIKGGMTIDKKEEVLLAFAKGEIKRLITKPKMTAFGLNWQHCNHTVYFPTFSYEQYYQAIRRFWRFGQKREVTVDLVYSEGQNKVIKAIKEKEEKAIKLFDSLNSSINSSFELDKREFNNSIQLPNFLK